MAEKTAARPTANTIQKIPLDKITSTHNPRQPLPNLLAALQAGEVEKAEKTEFVPMEFCHIFGLSDDEENRKHFCDTIEKYETEIVDMASTMVKLPNMALPEDADATEEELSVEVETTNQQIQPIVLRSFESGGTTKYGIAAGERRYIAMVYAQAKTGKKQTIEARVKKLTVEQAYWIGVEENIQRKDMDEVEKGKIYNKWAEENGVDGNPAPMAKVARHFKRKYSEVRGRAALARLPAERLALYRAGRLNLTDAIDEAQGLVTAGNNRERKGTSRRSLTCKAIEELFDATPRSSIQRLKAFAECMQLKYEDALSESDNRRELLEAEASEAG